MKQSYLFTRLRLSHLIHMYSFDAFMIFWNLTAYGIAWGRVIDVRIFHSL